MHLPENRVRIRARTPANARKIRSKAKGVFVIIKRTVLPVLALLLTISMSQPMLGQKKTAAPSDSIKIPFETYKLPNGLTVILSQDKTTPTVAVNVWYYVGSK